MVAVDWIAERWTLFHHEKPRFPTSKRAKVELRDYINNVLGRVSWKTRFRVIYDQLNPAYAKYYSGSETQALLEDTGIADVRIYRRHGSSWTVMGIKPVSKACNQLQCV